MKKVTPIEEELTLVSVNTSKGNFQTTLPIHPVLKAKYLLNRLIRYYLLNSKQLHYPNYKAGRSHAVTPSGTGRGKSRQPRASIGGQKRVANVPNAVGGPIAHRPSRFRKDIKLNKKEILFLKENALSLLLRRRSTTLLSIPTLDSIKFKDTYSMIFNKKIDQRIIFITKNKTLISSLKNHQKITFIEGFRYDLILKGGLKDKTIFMDEQLLPQYYIEK